ncbi:SET domain-containing protein 5 [Neurospora sp. IMI 360204]|nr:SET domain-containing protein 5 [Neurospora sp. IMI 360204]
MKLSGLLLAEAASIVLAHGNVYPDVDESHSHAYDHKACGPEGLGDGSLRFSAADILWTGETDVLNYYAANNTSSHSQEDINTPPGHNWSYTTPCFNSISSDDAFCVFTDTSYANGQGISFITTAQRAAYLASLPSFTSPSTTKLSPAKYTISSIPGKGLGLIAIARIPRSSLILSSHPTLMMDYRVFDELLRTDYISLQAAAISFLPQAHRSAFFNLSTQSRNATATDELSRIALTDTIITTNAFDVPPPPPPSPFNPSDPEQTDDLWYTVLASSISRLNHDCRPNADYRFDWNSIDQKNNKGLVQVVTAVRDILPGEEITISYINPLKSRQARQKHLRTVWGFECSCELCSRSKGRVEESDRRVRLIKELWRLLREEGKDDGSKVGRGEKEEQGRKTGSRRKGDKTKMAELLVSLYEMEGLWGMIFEAYAIAAREDNKVGEAWMAMKWAGLAVEYGAMVLGEGDEEVREMKELARDPWGHGSWRSRKIGGYGGRIG